MTTEYTDKLPEGSEVTVTNNTVEFDGTQVQWTSAELDYADAADHKTFVLPFWPVNPKSVMVSINAQGNQRYGTDFSIAGNVLTLVTALSNVDDVLYVQGLAYVAGSSSLAAELAGAVPIGGIVMFGPAASGPAIPTGYLALDGTTHDSVDYPLFVSFLDSFGGDPSGYYLSSTKAAGAATFTLKTQAMETTYRALVRVQ